MAVEQPGISWPHNSAPSDWSVIDLETTGLWPSVDRMVEICLARLSPCCDEIGSWTSLVDPNRDNGATEVHGLTAGDLRGRHTLATPLPGFAVLEIRLGCDPSQSPNLIHHSRDGGRSAPSSSGDTLTRRCPPNDCTLGPYADAGGAGVDLAVASATAAAPAWGNVAASERTAVLHWIAAVMERHASELADSMTPTICPNPGLQDGRASRGERWRNAIWRACLGPNVRDRPTPLCSLLRTARPREADGGCQRPGRGMKPSLFLGLRLLRGQGRAIAGASGLILTGHPELRSTGIVPAGVTTAPARS
jgi:hypothetical protein